MNIQDYLLGSDVLVGTAEPNTPIYTDEGTIRAVQYAISELPQYTTDKLLDLGPTGVDGKWGPKTATAVERFNNYYRAGGSSEGEGPYITKGTLDALRLTAASAPSGTVSSSGSGGSGGGIFSFLTNFKPSSGATTAPVPMPDVHVNVVDTGMPSFTLTQPGTKQVEPSKGFIRNVTESAPTWKIVLGGVAVLAVGVGFYAALRRNHEYVTER